MTFDESKIRRGQPANAGQFATKTNSAPASGLDEPNATEKELVFSRLAAFSQDFDRAYITPGNRPHITDKLGMNVRLSIEHLDMLRDEFDELGVEGLFDFSE